MRLGYVITTVLFALIMASEIQADNLSADPSSDADPYRLQASIDFDCLDGIRVDPARGTISLFGHRTDPHRLRHIPYFDYLATALQCKSPSISLEPKPGFWDSAAVLSKSMLPGLHDVANPFDAKGQLTDAGAWLLQKGGAPVQPGLTKLEAFAQILRITGHPDTAEFMELNQLCIDASDASAKSDAYLDLAKALGTSSAYIEIEHRIDTGTDTHDQAMDEYNPLFLRAFSRKLGFDPVKYTKAYANYRSKGLAPDETMLYLQAHEMKDDSRGLFDRTVAEMFRTYSDIIAPDWLTHVVLGPEVPQVYPVFYEVPPASWMARTMVAADIIQKVFISTDLLAPDIRPLVPGYRSLSEFKRAIGAKPELLQVQKERAEIVPGPFHIAQSPGGDTIRFLAAPMRFRVAKIAVDSNGKISDVPDVDMDRYADEISGHYDELARVFPILNEVRECTKVIAIARILEGRGLHLSVPPHEGLSWAPPEAIRAFVFVDYSVQAGMVYSGLNVEGGVALLPERNWNISQAPVTIPDGEANTVVPAVGAPSTSESDVRSRLQRMTNPGQQAGLEVQLSEILRQNGNTQGAVDETDKAVQLNPGNSTLILLDARAHYENGDLQGAEKALRSYTKDDPDNVPAQRALADIQQELATHGPAVPTTVDKSEGKLTPFRWTNMAQQTYATNQHPDIGSTTGAGDQLLKMMTLSANLGDGSMQQAGTGFDTTAGKGIGSLNYGTNESSYPGVSPVPAQYAKNPDVVRYDRQATDSTVQSMRLQNDIDRLKATTADPANKDKTTIELIELQKQLTISNSQRDAAEINKKETIRKLSFHEEPLDGK